MKKRRRVKKGRLLLVILLMTIILLLLILGIKALFDNDDYSFNKNNLNINELDYSEMKEFDFTLNSKAYMLIRLNDFKVLYGHNINNRIYPASLTKIVALDSIVRNIKDFDETSSITNEDYIELINENASMAGLKTNVEYSLKDLLYALVLPSGADASRAFEHYLAKDNLILVDEMNKVVSELNLTDSHFTNSSGLHDENLYTSLDDYCRIVIDTLLNDEGKAVLKSFEYTLEDGTHFNSTLKALKRDDNIKTYGGKTGFTGEAGENIMILYSCDNRSYMLILANADGNPYLGQNYHFNDVNKIFNYLYN